MEPKHLSGQTTPLSASAQKAEPKFPRGIALPSQSPLFWVKEKDRYLRQLLISDIETSTGRDLLVYFTNCETVAQIDGNDDKYLYELLIGSKRAGADLLLETNGGYTDSTEKLVTMLRHHKPDLRVIVPRRAKSNGTLLALCGSEILMGGSSELGPMDPLIQLAPGNTIPAQFIINAPAPDPILSQIANLAVTQTQKLAHHLLSTGMMKDSDEHAREAAVNALSTRNTYPSHGSVIDASEAKGLGLRVALFDAADNLWARIWLLRCMYEHDARQGNLIKMFEGCHLSSSIRPA